MFTDTPIIRKLYLGNSFVKNVKSCVSEWMGSSICRCYPLFWLTARCNIRTTASQNKAVPPSSFSLSLCFHLHFSRSFSLFFRSVPTPHYKQFLHLCCYLSKGVDRSMMLRWYLFFLQYFTQTWRNNSFRCLLRRLPRPQDVGHLRLRYCKVFKPFYNLKRSARERAPWRRVT
jgi:hypothetical protein